MACAVCSGAQKWIDDLRRLSLARPDREIGFRQWFERRWLELRSQSVCVGGAVEVHEMVQTSVEGAELNVMGSARASRLALRFALASAGEAVECGSPDVLEEEEELLALVVRRTKSPWHAGEEGGERRESRYWTVKAVEEELCALGDWGEPWWLVVVDRTTEWQQVLKVVVARVGQS